MFHWTHVCGGTTTCNLLNLLLSYSYFWFNHLSTEILDESGFTFRLLFSLPTLIVKKLFSPLVAGAKTLNLIFSIFTKYLISSVALVGGPESEWEDPVEGSTVHTAPPSLYQRKLGCCAVNPGPNECKMMEGWRSCFCEWQVKGRGMQRLWGFVILGLWVHVDK